MYNHPSRVGTSAVPEQHGRRVAHRDDGVAGSAGSNPYHEKQCHRQPHTYIIVFNPEPPRPKKYMPIVVGENIDTGATLLPAVVAVEAFQAQFAGVPRPLKGRAGRVSLAIILAFQRVAGTVCGNRGYYCICIFQVLQQETGGAAGVDAGFG